MCHNFYLISTFLTNNFKLNIIIIFKGKFSNMLENRGYFYIKYIYLTKKLDFYYF